MARLVLYIYIYIYKQKNKKRSSEKANCIYEIYINTVIPHGRHIYAKSYDMEKVRICTYPKSDHSLPQWKYVLWCCDKCPCVNLPDQEIDDQYFDTTPSIKFHIYHLILSCTAHRRLPLNYKKICRICEQYSSSEQPTKTYSRKGLVMINTKISNFYTNFYIPEIQKLEFHLPPVHILVTNHCGESRQTTFKHRESF